METAKTILGGIAALFAIGLIDLIVFLLRARGEDFMEHDYLVLHNPMKLIIRVIFIAIVSIAVFILLGRVVSNLFFN